MEALREQLAAISLELRNTQLDLMDAKECLAERARQTANRERVLMRSPRQQEVFVVLKFRSPQPLPIGGYRLFTVQRKAVDRKLSQFIADNRELDAVVMDELRFDPSPRGHNVFQRAKDDKDAPISSGRRNFILKDGHTEDEMIKYITSVFNTHTQENL
ncbi:hypothetical protein BGZ58_003602 [Dissophora ornata]|nr:hypothetical protein BGZ58_003602 [Dissophora ornata]